MKREGISRTFTVKWADLDANGHLRYSVYIDYAVDTQFHFLDKRGFSPRKLIDMGFGPVILKIETRYSREVCFGDTVVDWLKVAGLSPDGARWKTRHEIVKSNGEKAATLKLEGCCVDMHTRQIIKPPPEYIEALNSIPHTEDFEILRSFVRKR